MYCFIVFCCHFIKNDLFVAYCKHYFDYYLVILCCRITIQSVLTVRILILVFISRSIEITVLFQFKKATKCMKMHEFLPSSVK